ncbi:MAG: flagellar FliJ family protein [Deltaproteobacteria bacterium]|nr:flagellar FliJ family protein [Deltaproteobacteria bacterium]
MNSERKKRIERVSGLRRLQEDQASIKVFKDSEAVKNANAMVESAKSDVEYEASLIVRRAASEQIFDAGELALSSACIVSAREVVVRAEKVVLKTEQKLQRSRNELVEVHKTVRQMEILQDNLIRESNKAEMREEQNRLDDLASIKATVK